MKAAWYEKQGAARDVLVVGEMPDPTPGPGEVRIRVVASGINPGDIKKRQNSFGYGMPYNRVIPHSDGSGVIDRVGVGVSAARIGERVWCYGAQNYRPFGTAAEYVNVPTERAVSLASGVSFEQGGCLGIPGITAHRAVHVAGPIDGRGVLVQGGSGAVGVCAVRLARQAGGRVIATVRSDDEVATALRAGAHHVVTFGGVPTDQVAANIRTYASQGISHIVEVAFDANIAIDADVVAIGGSIAAYATGEATPPVPFWSLLFKNVRVFFVGSDDFPSDAKTDAARGLNAAFEAGWMGFEIIHRFDLPSIVAAHEFLEDPRQRGRVIVMP
jgi:NADPH2:quinone reductase